MHVDGFMKIESETLKGQPSNEKRIGLDSCVCMVMKLIYWHINSNPNAPHQMIIKLRKSQFYGGSYLWV